MDGRLQAVLFPRNRSERVVEHSDLQVILRVENCQEPLFGTAKHCETNECRCYLLGESLYYSFNRYEDGQKDVTCKNLILSNLDRRT